MNIEELRIYCLGLPGATEDIKWEDNLVFSVAEKIFCLAGLEPPLRVAFKVDEEEFEERLSRADWELHIRKSYELVKSKLPKKRQTELNQML